MLDPPPGSSLPFEAAPALPPVPALVASVAVADAAGGSLAPIDSIVEVELFALRVVVCAGWHAVNGYVLMLK